MQPEDKKRRSTSWKGKLGLLILSIGFSLLIIEVVVRYAGVNDQFTRKAFSKNLLTISDNPVLVYELKPGGTSSIDGVPNHISLQGLRDREYDIPKPPGTKRIVAIGDSVTYGLGVRAEETFPKQMEALFCEEALESGEKIEVLNMGVNGYKTVQEIEHLKVHGLRFEPDIVLLSYNLNDPGDFSRELPYFNTWQDRQWTSEKMSMFQKLRGRLSQFSELAFMIEYRTLRLRLGRVVEDQQAGQPDRRRNYDGYFHLYRNTQAMDAIEKAFDDLRNMAEGHNFRVVFVVFPLLMDFHDYRWIELHRQILTLADNHGFHTMDLLPVYQSKVQSATELQRRYDDFEHPNPAGHRIAAETIYSFISQRNFMLSTPVDTYGAEPILEPIDVSGQRLPRARMGMSIQKVKSSAISLEE